MAPTYAVPGLFTLPTAYQKLLSNKGVVLEKKLLAYKEMGTISMTRKDVGNVVPG